MSFTGQEVAFICLVDTGPVESRADADVADLLRSLPGRRPELSRVDDVLAVMRAWRDSRRLAATFAPTAFRGDLLRFLQNHHLPSDLVVPVHDMLLAQASTEPRFKDRCGGCHETAAGLARDSLVVQDGVLYGKETGRPVAEFLKRHGRVRPDEIPFLVDLLTRVEREVHGSR